MTLEMLGKVMTYEIRCGAIRWNTPDVSDDNIMFALSLTITRYSEIKKNAKTLALKMKVKVKD